VVIKPSGGYHLVLRHAETHGCERIRNVIKHTYSPVLQPFERLVEVKLFSPCFEFVRLAGTVLIVVVIGICRR